MGLWTKIKAIKIIEQLKADGKRVVFTNGCFDIIHMGHTTYLKAARNLGDFLIIGLNSDKSAKQLKGPERPINPEKKRGEALLALDYVDAVVIFSEETPLKLISKLRPHVLVKGGDYNKNEIAGKEEVEASGGQVIVLPFLAGYSTTKILEKMRKKA
ncbi:MAG: D-glycero-beta-D-manno-heptose 1-phosphate adenylyltransferase [Fidelibacterota bacterium]|jgi:rfaE bifunctional protein nucleotidyltransferase chain/domain